MFVQKHVSQFGACRTESFKRILNSSVELLNVTDSLNVTGSLTLTPYYDCWFSFWNKIVAALQQSSVCVQRNR